MTSWYRGPLCAFSTKTTCANSEIARIVSASVVLVDGSGKSPADLTSWLIRPGGEIPRQSTLVHGITTEQAREHGTAPHVALDEIADALTGAARARIPVIAFNAAFHLTVLDRDTRRHGLRPFTTRFPHMAGVIDPWVLDKYLSPYRKGPRTLTATCAEYGLQLQAKASAADETTATARLAWQIARGHRQIAEMPLPDLYALQVQARIEQAAAFRSWLLSRRRAEIIEDAWPVKELAGELVA